MSDELAARVVQTIAGHASFWAAIAADMGASLLVIANGLRLLQGQVETPIQKGS